MISTVIPMYNEENTVLSTADALLKEFEENDRDFEIIFSDDGSTDGTFSTLQNYISAHPNTKTQIKILKSDRNYGKGHAVKTGILSAKGEYIIFTDCDLAYGTKNIIKMADKLQNDGDDLVIGSRTISKDGYEGYSKVRKFVSRRYLHIIQFLCSFKLTDSQCGIKSFKKEAADKIFPLCHTDGFAFDLEVLMIAEKLGLKISEMPVSVSKNSEHVSKVRLIPDAFKMLSDIRKIKSHIKTVFKNR